MEPNILRILSIRKLIFIPCALCGCSYRVFNNTLDDRPMAKIKYKECNMHKHNCSRIGTRGVIGGAGTMYFHESII